MEENINSVAQLFKTALFNEVKAGGFYNQAAEITKNDESRMVFLELSSEEDDHASNLIRKAKGISFPQKFDFEDYFKKLETCTECVIPQEELETLRTGDMKSVLELAGDLEKKSRETYLALEEKIEDTKMKLFCGELAKMEEEHLNSVNRMIYSLDMNQEERPSL